MFQSNSLLALYGAEDADAETDHDVYAAPRAETDGEQALVQALRAVRDEVGTAEDMAALLSTRKHASQLDSSRAVAAWRETSSEADALELRLAQDRAETDHLRRKMGLRAATGSLLGNEVLALRVGWDVDTGFSFLCVSPSFCAF
jgi:hypothetical protein